MKFWSFVGACCAVVLSGAMLALTRGDDGNNQRINVVLVFFELYIFPLIKQLTSVFSCTSTDFWMQGEPFCRLTNTSSLTDVRGQCMDIDRTVACWGPIIWYILRSRCSC